MPYVTPGFRGAAVVAGINIVVFSTIAFLAHKEKLAKKRESHVSAASDTSEPQTPSEIVDEKSRVTAGVFAVEPAIVEAYGRGM